MIKYLSVLFFLIILNPICAQSCDLADNYWNEAIKAFELKNEKDVAVFFKKALESEKKCPNPRFDYILLALDHLALKHHTNAEYEEALPFYSEALAISKVYLGTDHPDYGNRLMNLANLYHDTQNYLSALPLYEEALVHANKTMDKSQSEYSLRLFKLSQLYHDLGMYDKALPLYMEELKITENKLGRDHPEFGIRLSNLATLLSDLGHYDNALVFFAEALAISEKHHGKNHPEYRLASSNLATLYHELARYEEAEPLYVEALNYAKNNLGESHPEYGIRLSNLALLYHDLGNYDSALHFSRNALENAERVLGKNHSGYGVRLNNLAQIYRDLGDFEVALPLFLKALENTRKALGEEHPDYGLRLNNLAGIYRDLSEYDKALPLYEEAIENAEMVLGKDHPTYALRLSNLAGLLSDLGQYDKALKLYEEALERIEKSLGKNHPDYGNGLNNLASIYSEIGFYQKALTLYSEAVTNAEVNLGKEHADYATRLNNLSNVYFNLGKYEDALPLCLETLKLREKTLGKVHPDYGLSLNNLAGIYRMLGQHDMALPLLLEAREIAKNVYGKSHTDYAVTLVNLAILYQELGQIDRSIPLLSENNSILWSNLNSVFSFSSEERRKQYLQKVKHEFSVNQSLDKINEYKSPEFIEMNLNNQFVLKGLLLSGYRDMIRDLSQLNDPELTKLISSFRVARAILSKQLTIPYESRVYDLDSLQEVLQEKESNLVMKHHELFDSSRIEMDWKTIQRSLQSDEVVVEFSKFNFRDKDGWTDNYLYVAYVFDNDSSTPTPIYLFEEGELEDLLSKSAPSNLYSLRGSKASSTKANSSKALYNIIWKPLETHFSDKKTIYFSPSGLLNQLALAALPDDDGRAIILKYDLYQMGNLVELLKNKEEVKQSPAIFSGGIQYDFIPNDQTKALKDQSLISIPDDRTRSNQANRWQFLPGTESEVKEIEQLYNDADLNSTVYTGELVTEGWFKSLSSRSPSVLHLATHGFFYENSTGKKENSFGQPSYVLSEDPLLRSGLVLAYGNYVWENGTNPYHIEDGILTAYEITHLDLQNTDLVVLSACETGLGDIEGSEGVYGLQRAFKMAGVKNIIMSLWEVPDQETAEFMTIFYKNWLADQNLRAAFLNAQRIMYERYAGSPEKWAAFVLIE